MPDDFDRDYPFRLMRDNNDWKVGDYATFDEAQEAAWAALEQVLLDRNGGDDERVRELLRQFRVNAHPMVFNTRAQWVLCEIENKTFTGDLVYRIKNLRKRV